MRLFVVTNVLVALGITLVGSVIAADQCKQTCKQSGVREDAISSCRADRAHLPPLDDCVSTAGDLRDECLRKANNAFIGCRDSECQDVAQSRTGRCTLTVDCVEGCLEFRNSNLARCKQEFSLKRVCTAKCVRQGDHALQMCVRECRDEQPILTLATSATMAPTSTPTTTTTSTTLVKDCNCQNACAFGIVGDCLTQCDERCEHSKDALRLCKNACRNAKCDKLQAKCTVDPLDDPPGNSVNAAYSLCCQRCGDDNCRDEFECIATTTSTSLTTTSTTAITTTSTSLTTTTTLVGF